MRIDGLDLIAFGKFTDTSLDLSQGTAGLHVIYGENEAGKSTSLRALIAWLFGIPARTNDNFLHPNPQLRIGGKLRLANGQEFSFVRRKGLKGTLLEPGSDSVLDDSALSPFLPAGIDEALFKNLYGIDHTRLIAGGQELLDQSGDLGQVLFSAAVGTAGLRDIVSELQRGAEEFFKPRASKTVVNQALSSYKDALKRIKEASLPVAEWKKLQKNLRDILSDIREIEKTISNKNKEKSRLDRLGRVKGALAERRAVLDHLELMIGVLLLPEDFDEKRKVAIGNLQTASEVQERAEAKLSLLKQEAASLNVRNELLENEDVILAMYKELGAVEKILKDRPQQDGQRRLLRNEAEKLLKGVRPDLALNNADQLRVLLNHKKWIAGLAKQHGLLKQKKETADARLREIEDEQKAMTAVCAEQRPSVLDLNGLNATIAAARKTGDLEHRLDVSQKRAGQDAATCENELLRLGRFSGTIETLSKIALPVSETLDRFEKKFEFLTDTVREGERKYRELDDEKKHAVQELESLLAKNDVLTIAQLEESRESRDRGWRLIKRKYIEHEDAEQDIDAFTSDGNLSVLYEQKVEAADHVADILRLDADQVVKRADLEGKIAAFTGRIRDMAEDIRKANDAVKIHQKEWMALWEPLEIDPGTPREMKQWLLRVEQLLANVQSAYAAAGEARQLGEECKKHKAAVAHQITLFDPTIDVRDMSLEAMVSLCEQRAQQEKDVLDRKREAERSLKDSQTRLKRTLEELESITAEQSGWMQEWAQAVDGLGLKSDVSPEHATETFDRLVEFFAKFDKSEELRRRIYGMDLVEQRFNDKVFAFADSLGYQRECLEASAIVSQANRDLSKAREDRATLIKIEREEKERKEEIKDAGITMKTAQEQLAGLRAQAGVATDDALEKAGEDSRNKRVLQKKLGALEQELTRNGDGLSLKELEEEFEASDIDLLDDALERVSVELNEHQEKRDMLRDQRQTIQNEIAAKDGSSTAAQALEEAEQQLAAMGSGVEKYLRLQIARLILEQQIEDYRKKNQAPVLARAGELFAKLTLGSYVNLRDELDNAGKPVLLGVRPNNDEVPIDGMSEGTRDQLYLALRLATLEQHLSKGEPIPFIVDDILIGFDDNRTMVCLEVLAELAIRTQVLLFTHHKRVLELAQSIHVQAGLYTHEL